MGSVTQRIFGLWQQTGLTTKEVWESSQEEVTGRFQDKQKFFRQKKLEVNRGGISVLHKDGQRGHRRIHPALAGVVQ